MSRSLFRVDHSDGGTAVDCQSLPVEKIVCLVAQEEAGARNVFRGSDPPRGVEGVILGTQLLFFADVDPTRGYGIDRDVERSQGDGQRMGQRVDAALRSGVGLGSGLALQVAGRAEVDDAAIVVVAVLLAVERQLAGGDEDRAQVGGDDPVELLDRQFGEGLEGADPDVVHQDVDVAPGLEELPHASFEVDGIGNIQLTEPGSGFGCGLGAEDGIDVAEDHFITLPGKGLDNSLSDSVGTARNEYASFHGFRIFPQR